MFPTVIAVGYLVNIFCATSIYVSVIGQGCQGDVISQFPTTDVEVLT